jgi:two-component system, OmpR family, sensor kinase
MTQPATLGRGLGRSFAIATLTGMIVFAIVVGIMIYIHEIYDTTPEDPPLEIIQECLVAFAVAAPIGIGLSIVLGLRLTRDTTQRLDEVIASASRMTGEKLDERLPVSAHEDALDQLSRALNLLLQRIESGVAAQREFAADASHELRTPLTVISTNLEVARRRPREAPHWEKVADETLSEVGRMHGMIDKLLLLARSGEAGLRHAPTDLRKLAAAAAERANGIAKEHDVRIDLADGDGVVAELDADAITIVLDNLLRNAIDHSPKGEAVVARVEKRSAGGARVVVEDRGPGVPTELRERIFQPFARGTQARTDRAQAGTGVGLGLAICKRIVAGHRGTIDVSDRDGGGARFVVELP